MTTEDKRYRYKCCVDNCPNKQLRGGDNQISFFHFPKEPIKRDQWLSAIGDCDLALSYRTISSKRLCESHFENNDFVNTSSRKRLKKNALPSIQLSIFD